MEEPLQPADFHPLPAKFVGLRILIQEHDRRLHIVGVGIVLESVIGDVPDKTFDEESGYVSATDSCLGHLVG